MSLDSTTISLCQSLFAWAKFRRAKGGVKAHVKLDHDDYMPSFVLITEAKVSDVRVAQRLHLNPRSILVVDRAYNDYSLFARWTEEKVFFVTRLKENTDCYLVRANPLPDKPNILADDVIVFRQKTAQCPHLLRRVRDLLRNKELVFLTNHMKLSASTIADIYKDRWEIELFFKALKQNLKVKTFVGTSHNALLIQIWTAMLTLLLLKWLHHLSQAKWSMSNLASMLRMNLFTYRDLWDWLQDPFKTTPAVPEPLQLSLLHRLGQAMATR